MLEVIDAWKDTSKMRQDLHRSAERVGVPEPYDKAVGVGNDVKVCEGYERRFSLGQVAGVMANYALGANDRSRNETKRY